MTINRANVEVKISIVHKKQIARNGYVFFICKTKIGNATYTRVLSANRVNANSAQEAEFIDNLKNAFCVELEKKLNSK